MAAAPTAEAEANTLPQPESLDPSWQDGPCQSSAVAQSQPSLQIPSATFDFVPPVPSRKLRPDQQWYIPARGPLPSMKEQTSQIEKNIETYREYQLRTQHGSEPRSKRTFDRNVRRKYRNVESLKPVPPAVPRQTYPDQPLYIPAKRRMLDPTDEIPATKKAKKGDPEHQDPIKAEIANPNKSCADFMPPAVSRKSYPDQPLYIPAKRRQLNNAKASDTEKESGNKPQYQPRTKPKNHKHKKPRARRGVSLASDRILANDDAPKYKDSASMTLPQPNQVVETNQITGVSTAVPEPASSTENLEKSKEILEQSGEKPQPRQVGKCKNQKARSWSKNKASRVKSGNNAKDPAASTDTNQTQKQGEPTLTDHAESVNEAVLETGAGPATTEQQPTSSKHKKAVDEAVLGTDAGSVTTKQQPTSPKHKKDVNEAVLGTVAGPVTTEQQPTSSKHKKAVDEAVPGTGAGPVTTKQQPTSPKHKKDVDEAVPGIVAGTITIEQHSHDQASNKATGGTTPKQKRTWNKQKKLFRNKQAKARKKKAKKDTGQVDVSLTEQDHNPVIHDVMHDQQHQHENQNADKAATLTQPVNNNESHPELEASNMPLTGFTQGRKGTQGLPPHATSLSMGYRTTEKPKPEVPQFLKESKPVANQFPNVVHGQPAKIPILVEKDTTSGDHHPLANSRRQLGTDSKKPAGSYVPSSPHAAKFYPPASTSSHKDPNSKIGGVTSGTRNHQASQTQPMGSHNPIVIKGMDPDEPGPIGNWNFTDSWAKPHRIKMPAPESTYDIDFSFRPRNDIVVKVAHTVIDRNGKQVVQTAVDPADKIEFPDLATAVKSPQQQQWVPPHKRGIAKHEQQVSPQKQSPSKEPEAKSQSTPVIKDVKVESSDPATAVKIPHQEEWVPPHRRGIFKQEQQISPQKQGPSKGPEAKPQSSPVINEVKAQSNAINNDAASSSPVTNQVDLTSQVALSNLTNIQPPVEDQSSTPKPTGILRYFRPLKPVQTEHPKEHTPAPATPAHDPVPSPPRKTTQGHLITEGSLFLTYIEKSGALTVPKKTSAGNNLGAESASPGPSTRSPGQVIMAQNEPQQQREDRRAGTRDSTSAVDEVVAGIKAKTVARPRSSRDSSNQSVRGRENSKLDAISVNLSFDDAFKGRNASAPSEKSVVLYEGRRPPNPYQTDDHIGDYEPGQLRGWDGQWAPAPIEWDIRDMYDYRKPEHQNSIKNFIVDRYINFKKGNCPALKMDEEHFTSGASLAIGLSHFAKPIDETDHHHFRAQDPFTLNKLHQTAEQSTKNYVRRHERIFGPLEKKRPKKLTEAEMQANQAAYEALIASIPPNKFKPIINIYVRPARAVDLPQIRRIHNEWVRLSVVTSERVELTDAQWRIRFDDCAEERFPFIVAVLRHGHTAQHTEKIVGFAYAEDFGGERSMWRYTCELQFYTDPAHLRQGIGKNLMDFVLRGLDNFYIYHDAVPFVYNPDEMCRHDNGGVRRLKNIMISFPYKETEVEQSKWIWDWLARVFEFEVQANLKGIGRKGDADEPINLAYLVRELR
ncbi:MAG: hypothetical protein Q9188_000670 [Gyalolechia gomerana]